MNRSHAHCGILLQGCWYCFRAGEGEEHCLEHSMPHPVFVQWRLWSAKSQQRELAWHAQINKVQLLQQKLALPVTPPQGPAAAEGS